MVIQKLLEKYENEGITSIERGSVLSVKPLDEIGSPVEIVRAFGKRQDFDAAVKELESELYKTGA